MTNHLRWIPVRRKTPKVEARLSLPGESIQTATGLQRVPPGDFILRDDSGAEWVVSYEDFCRFYEEE
ncbi:hypothetical protein EP7_004323 [Isosphaeraceae bacterium EP7]